jgi:hypothetical protein
MIQPKKTSEENIRRKHQKNASQEQYTTRMINQKNNTSQYNGTIMFLALLTAGMRTLPIEDNL